MPVPITAQGEAALDSGSPTKYERILINSVENTDVIEWGISIDRKFGCSTAMLSISNDSGKYSPNGTNPINYMDIVQIDVGLYNILGTVESWTRFYGYVRQVNPQTDGGISTLNITCLDVICKLEDMDIDQNYESTKTLISEASTNVAIGGVTPHYLSTDDTTDEYNMAQVFDLDNTNIAENPAPVLTVISKGDYLEDPLWEGFEINYEAGQIILYTPLNVRENYDLRVRYYYYPLATSQYAEDILIDLITTNNAYGNTVFNLANNLTQVYSEEEGSAPPDTMTPNIIPETIDVKALLNGELNTTDTEITVRDTTGFQTSGWIKIDNEIIGYAIRTATTFDGCTRGVLNTIADTHDNNSTAYQCYDAGYLWYTKYSNIVNDLTAANFTIPAPANFSRFIKRSGLIVLDQPPAGGILAIVNCTGNYTFRTIQATGVQVVIAEFKERKVSNRLEAIAELRKLLAPNYITRTKNNKIWGTYMRQKTTADYELKLKAKLDYAQDSDIYTRVKIFGENANPTNLMRTANFTDIGSYINFASASTLDRTGTTADGKAIFKTYVPSGNEANPLYSPKLLDSPIPPQIYINGIHVSQDVILISQSPCHVWMIDNYATEVEWKGETCYKIGLGQTRVSANKPIYIYTTAAQHLFTIETNDPRVDYEQGIWYPLTSTRLHLLNNISYATLWVNYIPDPNNSDIEIKFDEGEIHIPEHLLNQPYQVGVKHTISNIYFWRRNQGAAAYIGIGTDVERSRSFDNSNGTYYEVPSYQAAQDVRFNIDFVDAPGYVTSIKIHYSCEGRVDSFLGIAVPDWADYTLTPYYTWQEGYLRPENTGILTGYGYDFNEYDVTFTFSQKRLSYNPIRVDWLALDHVSRFPFFWSPFFRFHNIEVFGEVTQKDSDLVTANFYYQTTMTTTPSEDAKFMIDGLHGTQAITEYAFKPLAGTVYVSIDLGDEYDIQAIDLVAGFYYKDFLKINLNNKYSVRYSTDGLTYDYICEEAANFNLSSGEKISFEREELGESFRARYFRIYIEDLEVIETLGIYAVSFAEFAVYGNIVLSGECRLIPTTALTVALVGGEVILNVTDTTAFDDTGTLYINEQEEIQYTSKTATTFTLSTPVVGAYAIDDNVTQQLEDNTHIYDELGLLVSVGDKVYKETEISEILNSQTRVNHHSKELLKEFVKEHEKLNVESLLAPHIDMGMTANVIDTVNNVKLNYFVESINSKNANPYFTLARYP